MARRVIYPARRAVEHAVTVPGVVPRRLFGVLWPLWQVEITADVLEEQAYEVIDRFLVRAVAECGITTGEELSLFFGLDRSLVERCLHFLTVIGHMYVEQGHLRLSDLGARSHRDRVRYALRKESRQRLLFERFTGDPLPRSHYDGSVDVRETPEVGKDEVADGTWFRPLFATTPFQDRYVTDLAARPDRADYNLTAQLREIRDLRPQEAYLPAYLIETSGGDLLAYTAIGGERDAFLEDVCRRMPEAGFRVQAEAKVEEKKLWQEWLAGSGLGPGTIAPAPYGGWRVTLPARAFGTSGLPLSRVGSFQLRRNHFLQVWCAEEEVRQRALRERSLGMARQREVRTQADLAARVAALAARLETTAPSVGELRVHAERNGLRDRLAHLDALE